MSNKGRRRWLRWQRRMYCWKSLSVPGWLRACAYVVTTCLNWLTPDDPIMTIQLLYFARLREVLGCDGERLAVPATSWDVAGLLAHLRSRGGAWAVELAVDKVFRVAVNQELAGQEYPHTHRRRSGDFSASDGWVNGLHIHVARAQAGRGEAKGL